MSIEVDTHNKEISLEERITSETENYRTALRHRDVFPFGQILTMEDGLTCEHCKKIASRIYPIEQVPLPPHKGCTSECGCRCTFVCLSMDDYRDEIKRRRSTPHH